MESDLVDFSRTSIYDVGVYICGKQTKEILDDGMCAQIVTCMLPVRYFSSDKLTDSYKTNFRQLSSPTSMNRFHIPQTVIPKLNQQIHTFITKRPYHPIVCTHLEEAAQNNKLIKMYHLNNPEKETVSDDAETKETAEYHSCIVIFQLACLKVIKKTEIDLRVRIEQIHSEPESKHNLFGNCVSPPDTHQVNQQSQTIIHHDFYDMLNREIQGKLNILPMVFSFKSIIFCYRSVLLNIKRELIPHDPDSKTGEIDIAEQNSIHYIYISRLIDTTLERFDSFIDSKLLIIILAHHLISIPVLSNLPHEADWYKLTFIDVPGALLLCDILEKIVYDGLQAFSSLLRSGKTDVEPNKSMSVSDIVKTIIQQNMIETKKTVPAVISLDEITTSQETANCKFCALPKTNVDTCLREITNTKSSPCVISTSQSNHKKENRERRSRIYDKTKSDIEIIKREILEKKYVPPHIRPKRSDTSSSQRKSETETNTIKQQPAVNDKDEKMDIVNDSNKKSYRWRKRNRSRYRNTQKHSDPLDSPHDNFVKKEQSVTIIK